MGTRLETVYEQRMKGWEMDPATNMPRPRMVTYHIGHGQQLARRRVNAIEDANIQRLHGATESPESRQVRRRRERKMTKTLATGARLKATSERRKK